MKRVNLITGLLLLLTITACRPGPKEIMIGHDECAHCRMIISEKPYASQMVSTTGKTWAFDSIECLAAYELEENIEHDRIHSRWVPDFMKPEVWVNSDQALFLYSDVLRSPMGLNLSAYSSAEESTLQQAEYGGEVKTWLEVMELVNHHWLDGSGHIHEDHHAADNTPGEVLL